MEGVETDGWVTEMVRYVICPDEDIWYIWSDNARQRMTFILNVLSSVEICFYLLKKNRNYYTNWQRQKLYTARQL